ncbi:hypothetical protein GCM10011409_44360 [Lentibacillus populi]|uniref:Recombinase family protein n=1 Tax=Lentibacillus populi TaxID=1827502 RepID=A0A9W5X858_9BACI|nr:recombinase family protein [Lentibacillus populi]GGB62294.1 hypothetical protein GCM10011409_44360 [Lentibacillus populi]
MRCAIYIRVSTDKEEQKTSLKYQQDLFYRYVEEKGWDIYEFYIDVQSGTTAKRKNLQRMIEDAYDKKFDIILAKELSRLARNGELSYRIKNLCEQQGIHIITLDNAIDTLNGDTAMFGLYAWMYEQESRNTSTRVKESLKTRANKGIFSGSIPPYGYKINNGKLVIRDDDTPKIVKRIYNEYLAGKGRDSIARGLYNDNVPTPAEIAGKRNVGNKWNDSTIKLILSNPHYTGILVQGRTTTKSVTSKKREKVEPELQIIKKNTHEPIISREVFEFVQQQMKTRTKFITAPKKHLFTNTMLCADCGSKMWYRSNRKGYICGNYARYGKKACSNHAIKEQLLKDIILSDINPLAKQIDRDHFIKRLEFNTNKSKMKLEEQLERLTKQISILKGRKMKFINMLVDGKVTQEDYNEGIAANNFEINELISERDTLLSTIEDQKANDSTEYLKQELIEFLNFEELTPEILHRLISKIEVKEDGTPIIHYRFSNPTPVQKQ